MDLQRQPQKFDYVLGPIHTLHERGTVFKVRVDIPFLRVDQDAPITYDDLKQLEQAAIHYGEPARPFVAVTVEETGQTLIFAYRGPLTPERVTTGNDIAFTLRREDTGDEYGVRKILHGRKLVLYNKGKAMDTLRVIDSRHARAPPPPLLAGDAPGEDVAVLLDLETAAQPNDFMGQDASHGEEIARFLAERVLAYPEMSVVGRINWASANLREHLLRYMEDHPTLEQPSARAKKLERIYNDGMQSVMLALDNPPFSAPPFFINQFASLAPWALVKFSTEEYASGRIHEDSRQEQLELAAALMLHFVRKALRPAASFPAVLEELATVMNVQGQERVQLAKQFDLAYAHYRARLVALPMPMETGDEPELAEFEEEPGVLSFEEEVRRAEEAERRRAEGREIEPPATPEERGAGRKTATPGSTKLDVLIRAAMLHVQASTSQTVGKPVASASGVSSKSAASTPEGRQAVSTFPRLGTRMDSQIVCSRCGQPDVPGRCSACDTPYCDDVCLKEDWEAGDHETRCKPAK